MNQMMRLLSVKTQRRDRISADEEERQRAGHEIVTTLRFVPHGARAGQLTSTITIDGAQLGTMTYGDTALIRRMNVGLRRRKNPEIRGYLLDTHEGRWAKEANLEKYTSDPERITRVVPYVEDHRNALLLHLDPSVPNEQRMAAMYALKRAIEAIHQLESDELAVEPLPGRTGEHAWSRLLFVEAAEGVGQGLGSGPTTCAGPTGSAESCSAFRLSDSDRPDTTRKAPTSALLRATEPRELRSPGPLSTAPM